MQRVFVYIDGFNLYFGLKSKGWKRYYWLNLARLAENLLKPSQNLAMIRYFRGGRAALWICCHF